MVARLPMPSLLLASCWRVLVVNGAAGLRVLGVLVMLLTVKRAPLSPAKKSWAACSLSKRCLSSALSSSPSTAKCAVTRNCALLAKSRISRSRSTSKRTAGLCTRPADLPPGTLRHTTGLSSKPTMRSRICRACCASTSCISTVRGCLMAASMAGLVISWNVMRLVRCGSRPSTSHKCQAIASPSRSSSVASHTLSAPTALTAFLSSVITFFLSGSIS